MNIRQRFVEAAFWIGLVLMLWDFFEHSLHFLHGWQLIFSQTGLPGLHHFYYGLILVVIAWFAYDWKRKKKEDLTKKRGTSFANPATNLYSLRDEV